MEELFIFVREQYLSNIGESKMIIPKANIDYIEVLKYIENNQEIPYSNPELPGISMEKKNQLLAVKQKGQAAVLEMKKMAEEAKKLYGLDKCIPGSWLDGSNTKTRKYLWTQMKYQSDERNPISVSIFVEKGEQDKAYFRVSLEIKNDKTDKRGMNKYHKHLEIPKEEELVYVAGSNEWGTPEVLKEAQKEIKSKVKSGEYKKVQICKLIEQKEGKSNGEYHQEMMTAIGAIIPYYRHVLEKRGWLLTWNPDNWDWKAYEEWCAGTKQGKTYSLSWTCRNTHPKKGEEVFLMRTQKPPKGIIAHGLVVKESYEEPHYEPEKAAKGEISTCIEVQFDKIQNVELKERILCQDSLNKKYPHQTWSPLASGIEIKEPILTRLKKDWKELTGNTEMIQYDQQERELDKMIDYPKNAILYGPPGTGKTYSSVIYSVAICDKQDIEHVKEMKYSDVMTRYKELKEAGQIAFTTFHQSYGYEEFIEGIKPVVDHEQEEIGYKIEPGSFKRFCEAASIEENDKNYVFIIDEINRGNISKIFGELITLIEDTKRKGMEEEVSAILPYSRKPFSVPSNVYILGTMNTADRSIALMDTALRRRFEFIEMMPDVNVLRKIGADKVEDLDVVAMLETINERIAFLYDREHTIGHAFFTKLAENPTIDVLQSIFQKSVIPLLQEYFYEDYQKIQLVLGDNGKSDDTHKFILDTNVKVKDIFKGSVEDVIDLPEKKYTINPEAFSNIDSYKEII